jgi:adenylate cyclase
MTEGAERTERGREVLRSLLYEYNEHPSERPRILQEIHRRFNREHALLIMDAAGFSRTVKAVGIVHVLALLERLERIVRPQVEAHRGRILRREADNVFAVFPHPRDAVECIVQVIEELRAVNEALPEEEEMFVSAGIGFGTVLAIGEDDVYGDEMNLASKLGEDLVRPEEVLLTPAAHAALAGTDTFTFQEVGVTISGLESPAYRLALADGPS